MMITATVRVTKGAPEETELAALVVALDVLSRSAYAASQPLPTCSRRARWNRPQRRSGAAWVRALD